MQLYRNKTRAKISDFGTARLLHDQSVASTVVGTLGYIAPEILQQQPYDEKVDIFSYVANDSSPPRLTND